MSEKANAEVVGLLIRCPGCTSTRSLYVYMEGCAFEQKWARTRCACGTWITAGFTSTGLPYGSAEVKTLKPEPNMKDYQEHLDRHAGNEMCNICVLALRYKVREVEARIKELEDLTFQLRKI